MVRTNSVNGVNKFSFETFGYEKEDKINYKKTLNQINEKLSYYDYIFLIRIDEEYEGKKIKACYHYYLFPSKIFRIEGIEEMNIEEYRKKSSISTTYWSFQGYKNFYFKYTNELMILGDVCRPFINC